MTSSDDNRDQVNILPRRTSESPSAPLVLMAPMMQGGEVDLTPDERWYLSYFRKFTSLQCSYYFYDEFWERLVHQASHSQPAVRHAVIGMGALNWQFLQLRMGTHTGPLDRRFSLQQCNRAISHLQENLSDDNLGRTKVETALMTCLVLVCVILFQEDAESVGRHIKAPENLLKQYLCENPRPSSMSRALKQTFAGTRLVYTTFANQSSAKDDPVPPWLVPDEPPRGDENVQKVSDFLSTLARMIIQSHPYGFRVAYADPDLDLEPFAVMSKLRGWRT